MNVASPGDWVVLPVRSLVEHVRLHSSASVILTYSNLFLRLVERPADKWPGVFMKIPLFVEYPYLLPGLIAASITLTGSMLSWSCVYLD